jgi:hypothetical protein
MTRKIAITTITIIRIHQPMTLSSTVKAAAD